MEPWPPDFSDAAGAGLLVEATGSWPAGLLVVLRLIAAIWAEGIAVPPGPRDRPGGPGGGVGPGRAATLPGGTAGAPTPGARI